MRIVVSAVLLSLIAASNVPGTATADTGFYVRGGLGLDWSRNTRFEDKDCAQEDPPALFGCQPGSDGQPIGARGDFGRSIAVEGGVGYRLLPFLRGELVVSYRPNFSFSGEANFLNVAGDQPVSGDARSLSGMLTAYVDLVGFGLPTLGPFQPFVGAGVGVAHNRLDRMRYDFPGISADSVTVTPDGRRTNLAYMLTAGLGLPLSDRFTLDLAYRYVDLGKVQTDSGTATIRRPAGTFPLEIAPTRAKLRTHGVAAGLRYRF